MAPQALPEDETPEMYVSHLGAMSAQTSVIATFATEATTAPAQRRRPEDVDGDAIAPPIHQQVPEGAIRKRGGQGGVGVGARTGRGGMAGVEGGTSEPRVRLGGYEERGQPCLRR